jgi:mevalonate kinase
VETGRLMNRNHDLLARLGVSTPKLDQATALLRGQDGVLGAKLTGAGGGGAVIALTPPGEQHRLVEELAGEFPLVIPFTAAHGKD